MTPTQWLNAIGVIREDFKYYFADFVRKGGTPPSTDKNFAQKKLRIWGVTPPSPFKDITPEKFL